jgi:UDP-2,3-diacylglucosamine pyrophosphatase LpxH
MEDDTIRIRSLFISDLHLGTKGSQADALLDLLRLYEPDTIYLVGDIVDGWRLKAVWHWPQAHNDVVQKLLRKVRKGCRLIYIPGNHDEFMRDYAGSNFGGIEVMEEAIHEGADGRRALVLHGDKFDVVVRHMRWLALLGDTAYDFALYLNRHVSRARRAMGLPYWSFSAWSKSRVKSAVNFIGAFRDAVVNEARRHNVDTIICGHIHQAAIETMDGVRYINCGDWVESCTAIIETFDGRYELVHGHGSNSVAAKSETVRVLLPAA